MNVKGIGEKSFLKLKPLITVGDCKSIRLSQLPTNHAECVQALATFLVDNRLLSGEHARSECIRTRPLDAASLNFY